MTQEGKCRRGDHDWYEVSRSSNGQYTVIVYACRYCGATKTKQERSQ